MEAGTLLLEYGFKHLGLRRIQAVCDTANRRSYRTMEKLGMVRERCIAGDRMADGRGGGPLRLLDLLARVATAREARTQ